MLISNCGIIKLGWQHDDIPTGAGWHYQRHAPTPWTEVTTAWQRLGFGYGAGRNFTVGKFTMHYKTVSFPHGVLVVTFMMLPLARVALPLRLRRQRRRRSEAEPHVAEPESAD